MRAEHHGASRDTFRVRSVERDLLDADPGTALGPTQRIGASVSAVAGQQDFLIDNISNTLAVARDDAAVAKRLFVFLGMADALMNIGYHEETLAATTPDFFLAQTVDGSAATLDRVVTELRNGQAANDR